MSVADCDEFGSGTGILPVRLNPMKKRSRSSVTAPRALASVATEPTVPTPGQTGGKPGRTSPTHLLPVRDYDLAATLNSGQAFRWEWRGDAWHGVVGRRAVAVQQTDQGIAAQTAEPVADWDWLAEYLQTSVNLEAVLATFPDDEPMRAAVAACRGLRLLRQEPWECLASFILSSTKQITQIRQIVAELCRRFGEPLTALHQGEPCFSFPTAERLARCTEAELRECKAGFRAPYLLGSAQRVASGDCDLARVADLPLAAARTELMRLPGVGPKIADCALLFAFGFPTAFPLDVWVLRALGRLYFARRRVTPRRLRAFAETGFGPHAGFAQQYLFHYIRTIHPA